MTFIVWFAMLGAVLLLLALSSSYLRWIPVTSSVVCLCLGMGLGTTGLGLLRLDIGQASHWMEHLTEVAVLFSLFFTGLKLRLPLQNRRWWAASWLAGPVMVICIGGVSVLLHMGLGLGWGLSVLIGAMLAPTDPVLATLVQVMDAQDSDSVRFSLSGEAGLNDGVAFPFVLLGLLLLGNPQGDWLSDWLLRDVLWSVSAGLLCGYWLGRGLGKLTLYLRLQHDDSTVSPNDYLALALIAIAYVLAEALHGYGFLAVFAAGVGLRQTEVQTSSDPQEPAAEHLVQPVVGHQHLAPEHAVKGDIGSLGTSQVAAGIMLGDMLAFGSLVERALEVFLVTLLGVVVLEHWDIRALWVAAALFLFLRPVSSVLMPSQGVLNLRQRSLLGWFGIRGVGSLYYLFYSLNHGLGAGDAALGTNLVLSVVALSIVIHGISVQPLLNRYEAWKNWRRE
ncbi:MULTISPECIES: cation:proton antiporter [unclassified Pseudomonas]|uniref:cation:proton antiporter n=1 Tax=unclassified Pseudomonas TaxID=196821 RepID=UPI000D3371E9|nr:MULTISPECIES: cation:proton antiporter [unclassified Pseudomonas]RAU44077.1 sodium:proton antiporter [Pseudomonas sp. RIT 409]RAU54822.1 sodium:proton antiporter [Pseudomonas sp. RIT 412]